jgi:hypothetical protein
MKHEEGVMADEEGKYGKKETPRLHHPPHEAKWFDDFDTAVPDATIADIRSKITAMRKQLFADNHVDPTKYASIIRIEPLQGHGLHPDNPSCGCGCS